MWCSLPKRDNSWQPDGILNQRGRMLTAKGRQSLSTQATDYVDQEYPVDVIFFDFKKAFNKVPHGRLLLKVKAMGIGNLVANWIESRLSDRKQSCY